jgi:hypothetical protein
MKNRTLTLVACGVVALLFVALAVLYFTTAAQDLPAFLPGHQAGLTRHHTKHGIAMLGLAVLAVVAGWMLSGRPDTGASRP